MPIRGEFRNATMRGKGDSWTNPPHSFALVRGGEVFHAHDTSIQDGGVVRNMDDRPAMS